MEWELWRQEDDHGVEWTFIPVDSSHRPDLLGDDSWKHVWSVEAPGWNAALAARNEYLGWGPHQPMLRDDGTPYPEDEVYRGS